MDCVYLSLSVHPLNPYLEATSEILASTSRSLSSLPSSALKLALEFIRCRLLRLVTDIFIGWRLSIDVTLELLCDEGGAAFFRGLRVDDSNSNNFGEGGCDDDSMSENVETSLI